MTFLLFFRLLFDVSKTFIRWWWAAVALTFATFWVCIGSTFTLCGSASDLYNFEKCGSEQALQDVRATYKYWCALNVGTDLVVIALPLTMLYNLQLRLSQKLTLAAVFSLAFLVAIVDIIRTVESLQDGTFSGVALWSSIEVTVAVIVASLPLYKTLISRKGRQGLLSKLSGDRSKDGSPASTERRFFGVREKGNGMFGNDVETQDRGEESEEKRPGQWPLGEGGVQ
ncbi:MAG: hypothetical protein Q9183_007387 [Haloplaca sp. 2 TL-2023]